MRIRKILKVSLLSASFTLIGCIAESNSEMLEASDDTTAVVQEEPDSIADQDSVEPPPPPEPSNNTEYGNLFQGGEADFNVHTGFEEDETAGKWYITNDNEIGGLSNVYFPVPLKQPGNFDENISYCGGFCDTVKIVGHISTPYAGVGFNLVNKEQKGADITGWGGIVIDYVSTQHPLTIALVPEGVTDIRQFYHYDLPACPGHRAIRWSDFAQVDEKQHKRNKDEDLKRIAALQFIVGGLDGEETFIKINSLGTFYLREGEKPHEFTPASSSFYLDPASIVASSSSVAGNPDASSASSAAGLPNATSSAIGAESAGSSATEAISAGSSNATNALSEASSSGSIISAGSSNAASAGSAAQESSSSAIAYSLGEAAFPPSSSSAAPGPVLPASSSAAAPWPGFEGNGGWGGWGGF